MKPAIATIGVIVKPQQPEAVETVCRLLEWTTARGIRLVGEPEIDQTRIERHTNCNLEIEERERLAQTVDLLVVLGGDGTMIATARLLDEREIPVVGINYGTLGYLAEFTVEEMLPALEQIVAGEYEVERRMLIDASLMRDGAEVARSRALNEVVVGKSALARIIEIEIRINDQFVNSFRADGLLVSTPTGSTAYNLSAGGPIIYPSMSTIVITPICPHTLSNRPLVVPDAARIELELKGAVEEVALTVDGQVGFTLRAGDKVLINKSRAAFPLVLSPNRNYFDVLRNKLRWGR